MKKVISISVDEAMLHLIGPLAKKNLSAYFNQLLTQDVIEQQKYGLTKQLKQYLMDDADFRYWVKQQVEAALETLREY